MLLGKGVTTGIHRTKVRTVSCTSIVVDESPMMLDLGYGDLVTWDMAAVSTRDLHFGQV